ncbi:G1 family glutamic endopeptidase [Trebonia sp.]|uniref:G1 family glutamic endopeptidase n=1 Tax=Trebonia sp. TaxID=2767075 RepID=UPI0026058EFC|nr:G1 family glutamic endopeptidase [Trebonia sp.]
MAHRLPRFLLYPLAALLAALGLLAGFGSAAGASTHPSPAAQAAALARAAIGQLVIGQHATDQRVPGTGRQVNGLTSVESTNWSGYADTGSSFAQVAGSWTEPSASCSSRTESLAAFWVGIDGYSSDSVEQDGTLIECYRGAAYQYTWWEMYPANDIQVVGSTLAAGDAITASVVRSGTSYTLAVTDTTHTADSFSTTQTCSRCANSSAEWIAEAPSGSGGIYPLADFSSWSDSGSTVTEGTTAGVISSFTDDEITMVDNSGAVKALPGALNSSGNGFSVTWERAS